MRCSHGDWIKSLGGPAPVKKVDEIVKRFSQPGWEEKWKRDSNRNIWENCHAHFDKKEFYAPNPYLSRCHLFQWLHEHGHAELKHGSRGETHYHKEEYDCERWAINMMRSYGVPVPHRAIREAHKYVRWCMLGDNARGIKVAAHIWNWAKPK